MSKVEVEWKREEEGRKREWKIVVLNEHSWAKEGQLYIQPEW